MRTEPSFSVGSENRLDDVDHIQSDFNFSSDTDFDPDTQMLSDYRKRYGLSADPFADDHHFPFYTGAQRGKVLDQLLHLCQFSNNLLVVVGEYGVGKTRMAQALIDSLDDADDICFLEGEVASTFDMLFSEMAKQFDLPEKSAFTDFVYKQASDDGLAVLIVDNAHHLSDAVLLQLIDLIQSGAELRLHLVFFAEPHFLSRIAQFEALNLVLSDFSLERFSLVEAVDYLNFRMEMADYLGPELFTESKVDVWWRQSQGQLLVLHEYAQEKLLASVSTPPTFSLARKNLPIPHIIGAAVLGAGLLMGLMYWGGGTSTPESLEANVAHSIAISQMASSSVPREIGSQENVTVTTNIVDAQTQPLVEAAEPAKTSVNVTPPAMSMATVASSTAASDTTQETPYIQQSVVPLVQTNAIQVKPSEKLPEPSSGSLKKDVKKPSLPVDTVKPSAKLDVKPTTEKVKPIVSKGNYSEQEKTILSWSESDFTLQIVGLSSEKAVRDFVAEQANKKDLLVFKSVRQGKDWFVVITGRYPSSAKARQVASTLPAAQKKAVPWPRDLKTIQNEIKQRN